jgi:hypothetical protein
MEPLPRAVQKVHRAGHRVSGGHVLMELVHEYVLEGAEISHVCQLWSSAHDSPGRRPTMSGTALWDRVPCLCSCRGAETSADGRRRRAEPALCPGRTRPRSGTGGGATGHILSVPTYNRTLCHKCRQCRHWRQSQDRDHPADSARPPTGRAGPVPADGKRPGVGETGQAGEGAWQAHEQLILMAGERT